MSDLILGVQYSKSNGQISAVLGPRTEETLPPAMNDPDNMAQLIVPAGTVTIGKRVNITTLTLEDCPVYARLLARYQIIRQIEALDKNRDRAMAEIAAGRPDAATWLGKHLDAQDALRTQLAALPELSPDV